MKLRVANKVTQNLLEGRRYRGHTASEAWRTRLRWEHCVNLFGCWTDLGRSAARTVQSFAKKPAGRSNCG